MVDNIKITALTAIGANIAYTTLVPVVNMTGTPLTQKATAQDLGNLILSGAGGSYFVRAAQSNLALSVANAAQPNITSVGTLTALAVTGNITAGNINGGNTVLANFFSGTQLISNIATGTAPLIVTSTTQVANLSVATAGTVTTAAQPNITSVGNLTSLAVTGNVTAGNLLGIFANGNSSVRIPAANGNVNISVAGTANWIFGTDGVFYLPGNTVAINFANGSAAFSNTVVWTTAPIANTSAGTAGQAAYDVGGNLYICVSTNSWSKFTGTTSW